MSGDAEEKPADTGADRRKSPGAERQDRDRTPGDGTLDGATPAGLTVEELRERARQSEGKGEPGTG